MSRGQPTSPIFVLLALVMAVGSLPASARGSAQAPAAATPPGPTARASGILGRVLRSGVPLAEVEILAVAGYLTASDTARGPKSEAVVARARTDAAGGFRLAGLRQDWWNLFLRGPEVPIGFHLRGVRLEAGQSLDLGDLLVPAPGTIAGRVVDPAGRPLAGTRVWLRPESVIHFRVDVTDPAAPDADPSVLTDADGRFRFARVVPGDHALRAETAGLAPCQHYVTVRAGPVDFGELVVVPGRTVRGVVRGTDGRPLAGARVMPGGFDWLDPPARRQATVTAADGTFALSGLGWGARLTAEADGFQPARATGDAEHVSIELAPAHALEGRIEGLAGAAGTVELAWGYRAGIPEWMFHRRGPHAVAADGSFRIEGLSAGTIEVVAHAQGRGRSRPTTATLPRREPLVLFVEEDAGLEVIVRDERGLPVDGATVGFVVDAEGNLDAARPDFAPSTLRHPGAAWTRASADGRARLRAPRFHRVAVVAGHDQHLGAAVLLLADAHPRTLELVLPRGGRIAGVAAGFPPPRGTSRWVAIAPTEPAARAVEGTVRALPYSAAAAHPDAQGRFTSGLLRPGRYRVGFGQSDRSALEPAEGTGPVVPILTGADALRGELLVDVRVGETTAITLAAPRDGIVEGTVQADGAPVAGVAVWAHADDAPSRARDADADPDDLRTHQWTPRATTDAAGRFRFLVTGTGTWRLFARHPLSAATSAPAAVRIEQPGAHRQVAFTLGTGEVRGSYDLAAVPREDRRFWRAYLARIRHAHADPFHCPHHGSSRSEGMCEASLADGGAFRFAWLPPDRYVLWVVDRAREVVVRRVVDVPASGHVDLGTVARGPVVDASVECYLNDAHAVWLRAPDPGHAEGVYVRTVRVQGGRLELAAIEPGAYVLHAFRVETRWMSSWGIGGEPIGRQARLEIGADGKVTPAVVFRR